jgi:hypothetical protein
MLARTGRTVSALDHPRFRDVLAGLFGLSRFGSIKALARKTFEPTGIGCDYVCFN